MDEASEAKLVRDPKPLTPLAALLTAPVAALAVPTPPVIPAVIATTNGLVRSAWATSASQDVMARLRLSRADLPPENRSSQRLAKVSSMRLTAFFQTSVQASASLLFFFSASVSLSMRL